MMSWRISASAARLAVAEHGDAVGDALHLRQAMGDVDDCGAGLGDGAHLREEPLRLGPRQRLRRLVEHEHPRLERECLRYLE